MTLTVSDTLRHSAIQGLGHYRASRVVPNSEIIGAIDSSDEWIQQRSGIIERRFATEDETVVSMSVEAAREAIADAGIQPGQVDTVIVATVSHLLQTPSAASLVAGELGTTGAAFDISAACAGFCHGLTLASDLVRGGSANHVLVIGVERLSDITSRTDRGTAFIFSDGAGAAVVGPSDTAGIGPVVWGSDGTKADYICQNEDWGAIVASEHPSMPHLTMRGREVFRWAAFEMAKVATETLERSGLTPADLDVFVPHQANMRIIDAMVRAMKLPDTVRVARDIAHQGNASAASVPLALRQMVLDGEARSGDLALLIAFGAGLAYAAQVVRIP
ncbi:MAG TPA: beta-ketoacyl-ACP synthase III [Marmoricola sp.]